MAYTPLRNAHIYIQHRAEFRGNSLRGEWVPAGWAVSPGMLDNAERNLLGGLDGRYPTYVVYSYGTPIAYSQDGAWYVVNQKFSPTTSRHQGIVRRALSPSLAA